MSKILMYTTNKIYTANRITGGIKRFNMLYDSLIENNYNVDLYCGESQDDLEKYNKNAYSINTRTTNKKIFPSIEIMFKNLKLLKKLKKNNYDYVIVFDVPTAISLSILKFKNIYLFLRQDLIEYRKISLASKKKNIIYKTIYLKFMNFCEFVCLNNAKKLLVQCNYDLNNLIKRHRFIRKKIKNKAVIQINNVNAPWIVENSKVDSFSPKTDSDFKIGFIGDFSNPRKGHEIMLESLKLLNDEKISFSAFIIGDGKELELYKKKFANCSNINFLGRLSNPMSVLKNMDLMVVPSLADSCPNTILESLYNDVLVIGSDRGGIPEILTNKDSLFILNKNDLFNKIKKIYFDLNFREKMLKEQNKRKKQLTFDWGKKIIDLLSWR